MRAKIVFIERKFWEFVSIEKVFRQISKNLDVERFEYTFEKLRFGNNLIGLIKNLSFYKTPEADILHITGHIHYLALKLPATKTILTVHDLGFLHTNKGLKRYILKKLFLDLPIKKLKYITTISDATKREIVLATNCDKDKILVIENPLSDEFKLEEKKAFDKSQPRILQIGTSENKNLLNLIKALDGISCKLDIIGKLNDEQLRLLEKYKINFENSSGLNDKEIIEKYKEADLVTFCSTFEGFGLPIIEAQAMNTPVITSDLSPMKEVAGEGAVLANPYNVEEIRFAVERVISEDNLREKLVLAGLENIKRFDSKTISAKYQELYSEVIKDNS